MNLRKICSSIFFVALMFCNQKVKAACGLSIVANNISVEWSMLWTIQSVSITVSKTNPAACTFGLAFSKGAAASYDRAGIDGASQLRYQLYQDSGGSRILKDVPDTTTVNDVIMVTLPAGSGPQTVQYYFDIPYALATAPLLAAAGSYSDSFNISAYEGSDPALYVAPADFTAPVNVSVSIPKLINISIVDLGNVFLENSTSKDINFGVLKTGAISRFNMAVRTNAGLSITVTSTNAGRLKHVTKNSYVPYSFYVNNVLADISGAVPVVTSSGQTSLSGLGYPAKIVIGNTGVSALAGNYQDSILITATVTD